MPKKYVRYVNKHSMYAGWIAGFATLSVVCLISMVTLTLIHSEMTWLIVTCGVICLVSTMLLVYFYYHSHQANRVLALAPRLERVAGAIRAAQIARERDTLRNEGAERLVKLEELQGSFENEMESNRRREEESIRELDAVQQSRAQEREEFERRSAADQEKAMRELEASRLESSGQLSSLQEDFDREKQSRAEERAESEKKSVTDQETIDQMTRSANFWKAHLQLATKENKGAATIAKTVRELLGAQASDPADPASPIVERTTMPIIVDVTGEGKPHQHPPTGAPVDVSTVDLVTRHSTGAASPPISDAGTHYDSTEQEVKKGTQTVAELIASIKEREAASGETDGKSGRDIFGDRRKGN